MFNEFEMKKIILKTFLRIVLITCKTVSIRPFINREDNIKSSQFRYKCIAVTRTIKFTAVETTPSIYHSCSTQKTFWGDRFTLMNMISCGRCNVRKEK